MKCEKFSFLLSAQDADLCSVATTTATHNHSFVSTSPSQSALSSSPHTLPTTRMHTLIYFKMLPHKNVIFKIEQKHHFPHILFFTLSAILPLY